MSPDQDNPAGGGPGDISEDELRKILGDDYDSVIGAGESAGAEDASSADSRAESGSGAAGPSAPDAAAAAPPAAPSAGAGAAPSASAEAVQPNMTDAEAEAWAAQMEAEMERDAALPASAPPVASAAAPPARGGAAIPPPVVQPIHFGQLEDGGARVQGGIDLLLDVKLPISVELGRAEMEVKDILQCAPGTVIELNKLAGEPVDVYINGRMVAQGEVVVVEEHFGVRVTSLLTPGDRVRSLA